MEKGLCHQNKDASEKVVVTIYVSVNVFLYLQKKVLIGLAGEVVFVVIIAVITMLTLHTHEKRSMMVGIICDIFNIMMYVSPLTVMVSLSFESH